MKKLFLICFVFIGLSISSCKKCYVCRGEEPILFEGTPTGASIDFDYPFCEPRWKAKLIIEEYESDGYVCTEE